MKIAQEAIDRADELTSHRYRAVHLVSPARAAADRAGQFQNSLGPAFAPQMIEAKFEHSYNPLSQRVALRRTRSIRLDARPLIAHYILGRSTKAAQTEMVNGAEV